MPEPNDDDDPREDRIDRAIAEYLEAVERGESPDAREFLAQHPEMAPELSQFFADRAEFRQVARELPSAAGEVNPRPKPPSDPNQPTLAYDQGAAESVIGSRRTVRYLGDYELLEEIARGGMGVVYKARQVSLNRTVALKMILAGQFASADDVRRFRTEAEAAAQLDHPNIVPIYEVGQHEGHHYFSMGYVEGRSLAARVAEGPLPPREAADFVRQVAEAVQYAHDRSVIHRDLKPGNILLQTARGVSGAGVRTNDARTIQTGGSCRGTHAVGRLTEWIPKVTDFGLAKRMEGNSNLTGTGQILGTPSYMPPEQAAAKLDQIGPASDVYSLGAVLYCLLTGRPPFQAATPTDTLLQVLGREPVAPRLLNSKLPRDLETVCLKCLRKESVKRYPTAAALADDLGRWLEHRPIRARRVGGVERAWLWCKRRPAIASLSAAVMIISLVGSLFAVERQNAVYATGLVDSLVNAEIDEVPGIVRQLAGYARWARPLITKRFAQMQGDSREKLHLSLALVASGERPLDDLFEPLLLADATTFPVIRDALVERNSAITDRLWTVLGGRDSDPRQRRLRAAGALAKFDPFNVQWAEVAPEVAGQLVAVNPIFVGQWQEALRPVADRLAPHLAEIFTDRKLGELPRSLAMSLLVDFAKDDPHTLTRAIIDSEPTAFGELFPVLQSHQSRAIEELVAVLDRTVEPTWNDPPLDASWRGPAEAARLAIETAHGLLAERFAFCQDLPWSGFQQLAESLRTSGYRPIRVRPWRGNWERDAEPLVAAIWTRDGKRWKLETDLVADQLPQGIEPAEKDGLVPSDLAVEPAAEPGAGRRYVLLWGEPTAADEQRRIVTDASEEEIAAAQASFAKQRFVAQTTIGVWTDANGERHYLGIWSNQGAPSELRAAYAGFELVDRPQWDVAAAPAATPADALDGRVDGSEGPARYAAVWRADVEFESRLLGPESMELQFTHCRDLAAAGYRPVSEAGFTDGHAAEAAISTVWHRPLVPDVAKESLALRQATAAVALLRMGAAERVWPLLSHQPDPRLRSFLLDRLARYGTDGAVVLQRLPTEPDHSRRLALILALGDFARAKLLSEEQQSAATAALARWYADDDDAGIHGAAEWSLKQLGAQAEIAQARAANGTGKVVGERQWYLTTEGRQTLVILRPEGGFLMGSPLAEGGRQQTAREEARHWRRIGRTFAIGAHEVTVEQFRKYRPDHQFDGAEVPKPDVPATPVNWYDAAAFCNWLSEQEGLDRDQWCYDPDQAFADGMRLYPDYLGRTGYRLPTEAEWEFACRAGATTARHFGETVMLLAEYSWSAQNDRHAPMLPVGSLKPNDWGLFDIYGNALEWCQDLSLFYATDHAWTEDSEQLENLSDSRWRVLRGGALYYRAFDVRSAFRYETLAPMARPFACGFRVARTFPPTVP